MLHDKLHVTHTIKRSVGVMQLSAQRINCHTSDNKTENNQEKLFLKLT